VALLFGAAALTARMPSRSSQKEVSFRGHELPFFQATETIAQKPL
jgi:hypothetical protein